MAMARLDKHDVDRLMGRGPWLVRWWPALVPPAIAIVAVLARLVGR